LLSFKGGEKREVGREIIYIVFSFVFYEVNNDEK
jgi:hypothetical protein